MSVFTTRNAAETEALAGRLAGVLQPGDVVAYQGGLGAGKTTFTRGLVRGLGLDAHVSSPTFALINEYAGDPSVYHFDMYRIRDFDSLESTGYFDYLDGPHILAIEWSENIREELPQDTIYVTFQQDPDAPDTRTITIEGRELK